MRFSCVRYPFLRVGYTDVEGGHHSVKFTDGALEVDPAGKELLAALKALDYVTAVDAKDDKPATKKAPAVRKPRTRRPTTKPHAAE